MEIVRIKKLRVNNSVFKIKWNNKTDSGASFNYSTRELEIGVKDEPDENLLMMLHHELMEMCCVEMGVRLRREDCPDEYIFVYDHRQHTTLMYMLSGLIAQFIK